MTGIFYNCKSLTNLNISKLKTSYIINMPYMFYNCKNLTHLYLSGFNNTTVGNITSIFEGCSSLISLDISNFVFVDDYFSKEVFNNLD